MSFYVCGRCGSFSSGICQTCASPQQQADFASYCANPSPPIATPQTFTQYATNVPLVPQLPYVTPTMHQHQPPPMITIGAPSMPFVPPIEETFSEKFKALRQTGFHERVGYFKDCLEQWILLDPELESPGREFLENATEHFQSCMKQDEQICVAHNAFAEAVSLRLNKVEEHQKVEYCRSYCFLQVFIELLEMMHRQRDIAGAKDLLAKFEARLKYWQRQNYDAQGVIDSWNSRLAIAEEVYKRAQMNATVWTNFKTLPVGSVKQFETVYNLLKLLQSVYNSFQEKGMSIYRLKYMISAIQSMERLIRGELDVARDVAEADTAVQDLVKKFYDLVEVWWNDSLKTKGVISRLQDHVWNMESHGELNMRHLLVNSFIFMLSSLKMFQPGSPNNSNEERGHKVIRVRLKRRECFTDGAYELSELFQHIDKSKAVKLQKAYFVFDRDGKKGNKDDRKISGTIIYFVCESDEQAILFQKILIAWMLPKAKREWFLEQLCPELADLQKDDLSDVEDSERRLGRQRLLRKAMSLQALEEEEALQKDEELQEYLCTSDAWRGPTDKFDNEKLESFVGGSWSMAEEQKRDPSKKEEDIWFQKMMDAQKERFHFFFALKNKDKKPSARPPCRVKSDYSYHSPQKSAWTFDGAS